MLRAGKLDVVWLALVALTLGGAWLGESAEPGLPVTVSVAAALAFKGRMVIDHFMELGNANRSIRRLMRAYFYLLPLAAIATHLFGDRLARLTTF
jgi:hypothetical protein